VKTAIVDAEFWQYTYVLLNILLFTYGEILYAIRLRKKGRCMVSLSGNITCVKESDHILLRGF